MPQQVNKTLPVMPETDEARERRKALSAAIAAARQATPRPAKNSSTNASTQGIPSRNAGWEDALISLLEPGVTDGILSFFNYLFMALFLVLATMLLGGLNNFHVWIFMFLAVGLFASLKFYMTELNKVKREEAAEAQKKEQQELMQTLLSKSKASKKTD